MSQTVFNTYIEELFVRIRKAEVRVRIGNNKLGCIGYADDVVLTTEQKEDMNNLLQTLNDYGKEWEVEFS